MEKITISSPPPTQPCQHRKHYGIAEFIDEYNADFVLVCFYGKLVKCIVCD